ncbi:hypothetical protein F2P81_012007 [Scophthalmus maximus]|uniref:Uncharacterized protein n=1 Tax=Scophthalmus maximus TaxID=52904 RepID=A0A6A4SVH5_SCOMX|nr:hypothetical protein F2P81_012007 [Scophthalmus maximus]
MNALDSIYHFNVEPKEPTLIDDSVYRMAAEEFEYLWNPPISKRGTVTVNEPLSYQMNTSHRTTISISHEKDISKSPFGLNRLPELYRNVTDLMRKVTFFESTAALFFDDQLHGAKDNQTRNEFNYFSDEIPIASPEFT